MKDGKTNPPLGIAFSAKPDKAPARRAFEELSDYLRGGHYRSFLRFRIPSAHCAGGFGFGLVFTNVLLSLE
jgi:hypothetical protein